MLSTHVLGYRYLCLACVLTSLFFVLVNFLELDARSDPLLAAEWSDGDTKGAIAVESELDRILKQVSSKNRSALQSFSLANLHFLTKEDVYVTLSNMTGQLVREVEVIGAVTSLRDRVIRMRVLVPRLEVEGQCFVQAGTYEGFQSEATSNFSLKISNITGKGMAMLALNPPPPSFRVSNVLVDYENKDAHLTVALKRDGNKLHDFLKGKTFENIVVKKIWRDLTFHLNSLLKRKLATVLIEDTRTPMRQMAGLAAKIQESEINNTRSANHLVDQIVKAARGILFDKFNDRVPIPDIDQNFGRKVLFVIPLRGHFLANEGTARGLSTAYRTGDTAYLKQNRTTHFYGTIAFSDLNLYYDHYEAKMIGIGPTGTLNTKLRPINIQIHIYLDWRTRKIFLDSFKVEYLGDLKVEMTGLSVLNSLFGRITTWVVGFVRDKVVYQLEVKYQNYITQVLSDVSVDDIISGRAFKNTS